MLDVINSLYSSNYTGNLEPFNGLLIPFDKTWKNISIAVSGGADSALLGYLLSKKIQETASDITVHIISNVRCWKTRPWQKFYRLQVTDYLQKSFPDIKYLIHENFVPPELEHSNKGKTIVDEYGKLVSGDTLELRSFAEYVNFKNKCSAYYNAITRNPPGNFKGELESRNVDPSADTFRLMVMNHLGTLACHPFRFIDKNWITKQYFINEIADLLELTRSCEGEFENINYTNYEEGQYVPLCNNCFWCQERKWALENV